MASLHLLLQGDGTLLNGWYESEGMLLIVPPGRAKQELPRKRTSFRLWCGQRRLVPTALAMMVDFPMLCFAIMVDFLCMNQLSHCPESKDCFAECCAVRSSCCSCAYKLHQNCPFLTIELLDFIFVKV